VTPDGPPREPAPPGRVPRSQRPLAEPMSRRNVVIFAVFIGVLYAVGMVGRGEVAAGLVGGVLCSVLAYLVFTEVGNRQRRRIAARERRRTPEA
jgi:hypothetical protein